MILEGIVTTVGPDGAVNIAPMGPHVDEAMRRFTLRPFPTAQTYKNLCAHGEGVLHVTDDVLVLAQAAVGRVEPPPLLRPAEQVRGFVLSEACRYYEFRVVAMDTSEPRLRITCEVVHAARQRDFFGFNRAMNAVVEAAILATRTHLLSRAEIDAAYARLGVIVGKTGGPREREAFEFLQRYVAHQGGGPTAGSGWACVRAPSRLHFGLLGLPAAAGHWPDLEGHVTVPARHFGGAGLMVREPGVELAVRFSDRWSAEGPSADRALAFARRCTEVPCEVVVRRCAPEHAGLGTGTQLGLAVARALAALHGDSAPANELARRVGRGLRSAIGIHGFARGGFLVEGGKAVADEISPLVARVDFPDEWRLVIGLPAAVQGLHGAAESRAFGGGVSTTLQTADALCRLVLLGMLPALESRDLRAFGEALYDFNRRAGDLFRAAQGGIYADARIAEAVAFLRRSGVAGVGQSSWGPATFAVVEADEAPEVARRWSKWWGPAGGEVWVTEAQNRGA
jgi:beta-RFAP synthase